MNIERFWAQVNKTDTCWLWKKSVRVDSNNRGYAKYGIELAHRISYKLLVGPIPAGFQIDHLCGNKTCVNPTHLEPVTPRTNVMRAATVVARNAAKTHCPRGHEYNASNTYVRPDGKRARACIECQRFRDRLRVKRAA